MNRPVRSALPFAAAAAMLALAAQPALAQSTPSQTVEISATPQTLPDAATMHAMTGDFALGDGRMLKVSRPGLNLMLKFDRGYARAVEPVGMNRFASSDGRLVVAFEPGFDTLTVIEDQRVTVASRGEAPALR